MKPALFGVLGLGSNLSVPGVGAPSAVIAAAFQEIQSWDPFARLSPLFQSAPHGPPQPDFVNAAALLHFAGSPGELLARCRVLEDRFGRKRTVHWGPRSLDVDILWLRDVVISTAELQIPHAMLTERAFALHPLLLLVPDARDPRSDLPLSNFLPAVAGQRLAQLPSDGLSVGRADR